MSLEPKKFSELEEENTKLKQIVQTLRRERDKYKSDFNGLDK